MKKSEKRRYKESVGGIECKESVGERKGGKADIRIRKSQKESVKKE